MAKLIKLLYCLNKILQAPIKLFNINPRSREIFSGCAKQKMHKNCARNSFLLLNHNLNLCNYYAQSLNKHIWIKYVGNRGTKTTIYLHYTYKNESQNSCALLKITLLAPIFPPVY